MWNLWLISEKVWEKCELLQGLCVFMTNKLMFDPQNSQWTNKTTRASVVSLAVCFSPSVWAIDWPRSLAEVSSCLPATGNSSTQMRHLVPRCRPLTGRPCPDGRHFFHHKDTSLPPALEPPVLQPGSSLIKRSCALEADMPPNQAHFSFPCEWWRKRGGGAPFWGDTSFFLSFPTILTSVCVAPCRCPSPQPPPSLT